ncbi:MAG: hypothetical protein HQ547_04845 [Candidatus Omnitrophica bacterium]|nr:hypothetical protein [Candidatus Omnitrophota bacterium]
MSMICGSKDKERFKAELMGLIKKPPFENIADGKFKEVQEKEGGLTIKTKEDFTFNITDIVSNKNELRARVELRDLKGLVYSDTISLHSGKSRKQFANKCVEMGEIEDTESSDLEKYLMNIELIARDRISENPENINSETAIPEMTEQEKEEALELLMNPLILNQVEEDLNNLGHVGEEKNKLLIFLVCCSRKLLKPLAVVIRGESSAGKNALANAVLSVMPPEETKVISRATPNALYYLTRSGLENFIVCVAEKSGAEEADYSFRTLLSEGKLVIWVPMRDESTGKMETQEMEVRGPIAYIETTTQTTINNENLNRMFSIYVDESEDQTRLIHEAQRREKTLEGLQDKTKRDGIIKKHRNAQRLLKKLDVVIPYAEKIEFPMHSVRTRRDHEKFLYLIMTIAFLRQYQKEERCHEGNPYVEADFRDYKLAHELGCLILGQTIDEVSKKSRDLLQIIGEMISQWVNCEKNELELNDKAKGSTLMNIIFTRAHVRNHVKSWSDAALYACMQELARYELLRVIQGGQGKTYRYTLAASDSKTGLISGKLLTPQRLKEKLDLETSQELFEKSQPLINQ